VKILEDHYKLKIPLPMLIVLVFAFCVPLFASQQALTLLIPALSWSVACMGWTLIVRTGQISMGQAAFMAIGAYATTLFAINLGVPFGLDILLGGLISGVVALLVGIVVLRLGGMYFSVVTLAFGELVRVIALNAKDITNGVYGLIVPQPQISAINTVVTKVPYYYMAIALVIAAALVFWRFDASRLGRVFRSISSSSLISQHSGVYLMKYRVIAFTFASMLTGFAGGLYCHYLGFIGPTVFQLWQSIMILIMSTVGGIGSAVAGPILGAMVLSPIGDYLTTVLAGAKPFIFGIIVVVVIFFLPGGLVSLRERIRPRGQGGGRPRNIDLENAARNLLNK
jgi:branched-chain amino acid transport system permease protein